MNFHLLTLKIVWSHSLEVICKQERIRWSRNFICRRRWVFGFERIDLGLMQPAASKKEDPFKLLSNIFSSIPMITKRQSFMNLLTSSCNNTSLLINSMVLRSVANPIVIDFNGRKFSFSLKWKFWSWLPLTMLLKTSGLIIKSI